MAYSAALTRVATASAKTAPPEVRATAVRELETVLASYPSGGMAAQAALELAGLRYADRQYAQARSAYEIAAARAGSGTLRALARAGIAGTWEAERNFGNAAEAYRAVLADLKPKEFLYEDTMVDLARVLELGGKKDDAIATYRRLLKDVPQSKRAEDVRARLASLGAAP
jgi:tetratricopeptide (TPR) repeat protein